MPPDDAGAVGEPGRTGVRRGGEQQRGGVHRAGREHHRGGADDPELAAFLHLDALDAASVGRREEAQRLRARAQGDVGITQRRVERGGLRIELASRRIGIGVPRRRAAGEPAVEIDRQRQREGREPLPAQPLAHGGDGGLVRHRGMGIRRRAGWLGRVLPGRPAHVEQRLGSGIPGLQGRVGQRPCRRHAVGVLHGIEVALAVADQHGAVELRVCRRRRSSCRG